MLAVPIKACVALTQDILPKLKTSLFIEQGANEPDNQLNISREDLENQFNEFVTLREAALRIEKPAQRNEEGVEESLLRYASALCNGKIAFGATLGDNMTFSFSYRDAFKPALICSARSTDFERTAVLYNLGALYSQQAAQHVRSDLVGIRAARDGFQRAAGGFLFLEELLSGGALKQMGLVVDPCDLSPPGLRMTTLLMLAQAQACCYEEALKGGHGAGDTSTIAKLAAAAAAMYGETVAVQKNSPELLGLDPSWARHILFQHLCFEAVASWWRSKELAQSISKAKAGGQTPDLKELRERVDRLRGASASCDSALNAGGGPSAQQAQGLKSMVTQELVQAQLDLNSSDWAEDEVPVAMATNSSSSNQWPDLVQIRTAVATPLSLAVQTSSTTEENLLEPPSQTVELPFSKLPSRAMRVIAKQECSRISSDAQRCSNSLVSMVAGVRRQLEDTATSLDAFSLCILGEVPDHLWSRIEEWQAKGGSDALHVKLGELNVLADDVMKLITETRELLSKEEEAAVRFLYASEQAGDQERIQLCQSAGTALQSLLQRLGKLQEAWTTGRDADEALRKNISDDMWAQGCALFMKDRKELADTLRRASKLKAVEVEVAPSVGASSALELNDSLLESGEEIALSSSEEWGRVEALKRAVEEVVPLLTQCIADMSSKIEAHESSAKEVAVIGTDKKEIMNVLATAAQLVASETQVKGYGLGVIISERDAVQQALQPMRNKLSIFERESAEHVSTGQLTNATAELARLKNNFLEARDSYDNTRLAVACNERNPEAVKQMQQEYEERANLVHIMLTRSNNAWKHLDQGSLWYSDLAGRINKVKIEAADHCCAQEMLRCDFGQSGTCDEDAAVALRIQEELQGELEREYHSQLERSHQHQAMAQQQASSQQLVSPPQAPSQSLDPGGKTKLATKIPSGIGPGSRIKINLPGSGREIELTVPPGMTGGDTMEFLVPNSYLTPPNQPDDIVVLTPSNQQQQFPQVQQQFQQFPQVQQQISQQQQQQQFPPHQQFQQQVPQQQGVLQQQTALPPPSTAPPPNMPPPAYSGFENQPNSSSGGGNLLNSNGQTPLIPDYSQSARSYSSDQTQTPQEESILTKADNFFKNMFGGNQQGQQQASRQQPQQQPQRRFSAPPSWTPTPPPPAPEPEPEVSIDENVVRQLMEMGFSRESVTLALLANRGESEGALNALLTSDETEALRVSMS